MSKGGKVLIAILLVTALAASVVLAVGCTSLNLNGNGNKPGYNPNTNGNGGSGYNPKVPEENSGNEKYTPDTGDSGNKDYDAGPTEQEIAEQQDLELAKQYETELETKLADQVHQVENNFTDVDISYVTFRNKNGKNLLGLNGTARQGEYDEDFDCKIEVEISDEDAEWVNEVFDGSATTEDLYSRYTSSTVKKLADLFGDGSKTDGIWLNGLRFDIEDTMNL